jgi:hypothetical protein
MPRVAWRDPIPQVSDPIDEHKEAVPAQTSFEEMARVDRGLWRRKRGLTGLLAPLLTTRLPSRSRSGHHSGELGALTEYHSEA